MARVLVPVMPRRYNDNPRGSATSVVTMRGSNPFESGVAGLRRVSPYPGQLAGLGGAGLGDDPAPMGPPLPPTSGPATSGTTPINWTGMVQAVATAAQPIVAAQAARLLPRPAAAAVTGAGASLLPVGAPLPKKPATSKTVYVAAGAGVLVLGAVVFLMMRRK